jgi:protein-S-isoprenylcysteine O-methyltransferase Ste14
MLLAPLGALAFFILITLFVVIPWLLDAWLAIPRLIPPPYNVACSAPIMAIGLILVIWCNIHFFLAKGSPVPLNPPKRLVEEGPYKYTRNPMVTGLFMLLLGAGIYWGSFFMLFVFTPLFIALNAIELKQIEEPELEQRLGEPYVQYKRRVPMFFPRIGKHGR